jgi:hypothetical protein
MDALVNALFDIFSGRPVPYFSCLFRSRLTGAASLKIILTLRVSNHNPYFVRQAD